MLFLPPSLFFFSVLAPIFIIVLFYHFLFPLLATLHFLSHFWSSSLLFFTTVPSLMCSHFPLIPFTFIQLCLISPAFPKSPFSFLFSSPFYLHFLTSTVLLLPLLNQQNHTSDVTELRYSWLKMRQSSASLGWQLQLLCLVLSLSSIWLILHKEAIPAFPLRLAFSLHKTDAERVTLEPAFNHALSFKPWSPSYGTVLAHSPQPYDRSTKC